MLVTLLLFAILLFFWCYSLSAVWHYAIPALRTGILQARGRTYSRAAEPVRFWMGILFWGLLVVVASFALLVAGVETAKLLFGVGTPRWS